MNCTNFYKNKRSDINDAHNTLLGSAVNTLWLHTNIKVILKIAI